MNQRLLLFLPLVFFVNWLGAQSLYETKDTTFAGFITTISYIPSKTDSTEAIFVIHGTGERGTTTNYNYDFGPHYYLKYKGWDGAVTLGNGVHYPVYITLQRKKLSGSQSPAELKQAIDLIKLRFPNIKKKGFHAMCLSMGFAEIGDFITTEDATGYYGSMFRSVVSIQGYNPTNSSNVFTRPDSVFGRWAKNFGGKMLGFGQLEDQYFRCRRYSIYSNMNDSAAGSGNWLWTRYSDSTHCCWNSVYSPSAKNWTTSNQYVVATYRGFASIPIAGGQNIYQWALRQGDTSVNAIDVACSSLQFNGDSDYVKLPDFSLTGDFTIESWVKLANTPTNQDVVLGHTTLSRDLNFSYGKYRLYDASTSPVDVIAAKTTITVGVWTHYAITRSGGTVSLYINGQLDTARNAGWTKAYPLNTLGRMKTGYYLTGNLDEVRIWTVARTATEISANYNKKVADNATGLLAYYRFNEDASNSTLR